MAGMVFFTDNYQDRSTDDGYQFEFYCQRCGNGYSSSFQHSVAGFGGGKIQNVDWTKDVNYRDQATATCPNCSQSSGGGKFCQNCGHTLAAAEPAKKFCVNRGTVLSGAKFCGECGTPAG